MVISGGNSSSASDSAYSHTFLRSVVWPSVVCQTPAPYLNRSTDLNAIWQVHLCDLMTQVVRNPWPSGKKKFGVKLRSQNTQLQIAAVNWRIGKTISSIAKLLWRLFRGRAAFAEDVIEGSKDYCPSEHFNVTCAHAKNQVILMQHAQYGRMRSGRCVSGHHGVIGCAVDVLTFFDRRSDRHRDQSRVNADIRRGSLSKGVKRQCWVVLNVDFSMRSPCPRIGLLEIKII